MKSEKLATAIDKRRKREVWTWRILLCAAFFTLHSSLFISCSEDSEVEGDFDNWQKKNEVALDQWASNSSYRKILTYTLNPTTTSSYTNLDYIYVEVLESGITTESPLFTDSVLVAYRGRYIPTKSYPEGRVFDESYIDTFSWKTAGFVRSTSAGFIEGFSTALQNMHPGDHWRVHIPYGLAYGAGGTTSILGYSNLTFDIALLDYWHPGDYYPIFKSR